MIDDEAELVDAVKMRLEANGYEVIAACDGEEGVKKSVSEHPDLIILDMVMPKINGIEALSRIKSDPRTLNIPVVMLTAKSEREYILDAGKLGAADYIVKPVSMQELVVTVDKFIH